MFLHNQRPNDAPLSRVRYTPKKNMEHKNTFQVEQWSDAHQEGLSIPDRVDLIRMRDVKAAKLVKYVEPQGSGVEPVVTLPMKRYFAAGSVTTVWLCVFSLVEQGVLSGCAIFLGWVVAGGCAVGIVSIVLKSCLTWTPSGASYAGNSQGKTGGNNYYQYNNFGEQPNQNNGTK